MAAYFVVSLLASIAGAICGIGGGVIIKPVLDMLGLGSVSVVSFLSGCTVLSMSCYSVGKSILSQERTFDIRTVTPLAVGAAAGGILGKQLFSMVKVMFAKPDAVGSAQAVCLGFLTVGTLLYTLKKEKIRALRVKNPGISGGIGCLLGLFSSFLGIGGGPINLVILHFFFGLETKTAAASSLYIILFSQISSLLTAMITCTVPEFQWPVLVVMVLGGILGGILGRYINSKISSNVVDKLFVGLMILIIGICIYNSVKFL